MQNQYMFSSFRKSNFHQGKFASQRSYSLYFINYDNYSISDIYFILLINNNKLN